MFWYSYHCNVILEITDIKCGLSQNTCFKDGGSSKLLVNNTFAQEILFTVITWNKKHSSKQLISMINTLGSGFFAALLLLKVCKMLLEKQNKNDCSILWSVWVFFAFLKKRRPKKYFLWEENLVFHM